MKKEVKWQIFLGAGLMIMSAAVYSVHYLIFRDTHHIFIYMLGDLGFVFLEVMLVTLIVHQLLSYREKRSMMNKLNMVIGVFFSEVGSGLLRRLKAFDRGRIGLENMVNAGGTWSAGQFLSLRNRLKKYDCSIEMSDGDLAGLRSFLAGKRSFMINLLENQNLLEHESFTDLLWASFHLTEELLQRQDLAALTGPDSGHIAMDIKRVYIKLISEWIDYMRHLKKAYPYLFSLAVRMNPFDDNSSVEVL